MKAKRINTRPYRRQQLPLPTALFLEFSAQSQAARFENWVFHTNRECTHLKTLRTWQKEAKKPEEKENFKKQREETFKGLKTSIHRMRHFLVQHGVVKPLHPNPNLPVKKLQEIKKTCNACNVDTIIDNIIEHAKTKAPIHIHHLEILTPGLHLENRTMTIVLAQGKKEPMLKEYLTQLKDAKTIYNQALHVIYENNSEFNTKQEKNPSIHITGKYTPKKQKT